MFGQHLVGGRDEEAPAACRLGDEALVLRVAEGEEEADRQRLRALGLDLVQEPLDL